MKLIYLCKEKKPKAKMRLARESQGLSLTGSTKGGQK